MNEDSGSKEQEPGGVKPESGGEDVEKASAGAVVLPTLRSHQIMTLIGISFVLFEIVFVSLFAFQFWFPVDILWLGVPCVLLCAGFGHFLLSWLEGPEACRRLSFVWQGRPPLVYKRWLTLHDDAIQYGERFIRLEAIDELDLSMFANLIIKSRMVCGSQSGAPDVVLKMPFSVGDLAAQKRVIEHIRGVCPQVATNRKLESQLTSPVVKGQAFVQLIGVSVMAVLLLDLSTSAFYYLEVLKRYHLAHYEAVHGTAEQARVLLQKADDLFERHGVLSFVRDSFVGGGSGAGVLNEKALVLEKLGDSQQAIAVLNKALEKDPYNFRLYLHEARLLAANKQMLAARAQVADAELNHKDSLLTCMYMLALVKEMNPGQMDAFYKRYLENYGDTVFGDVPNWPPGGDKFLSERFYDTDMTFIFDILLHPTTPTKIYDLILPARVREDENAKGH